MLVAPKRRPVTAAGSERGCTLEVQGRAYAAGGACIAGRSVSGYVHRGRGTGATELRTWGGVTLCRRGDERPEKAWRSIDDDGIGSVPVLFLLPHGRVMAGARIMAGDLFRGELLEGRYVDDGACRWRRGDGDSIREAWAVAEAAAERLCEQLIEEDAQLRAETDPGQEEC